uniref:Uncharacterized protein n=1 Tax=viral metagenome TaxID=1070528 RepID=A0A6M3LQP4_9ZZZZ
MKTKTIETSLKPNVGDTVHMTRTRVTDRGKTQWTNELHRDDPRPLRSYSMSGGGVFAEIPRYAGTFQVVGVRPAAPEGSFGYEGRSLVDLVEVSK